ncbi:MAG: intradiol ring-cleavage dioxygenase [Polaromonas sp.]|uniref:protocatechuate 3,4-dioxygenase n=1 Tax=Polaromonas sp. TaxID=1869339 RepID=UPI0025D6B225|nr:protocatechuate 3,4-dioxygenase [Polaromonas sp.]MBI2728060.1 intradiol ring-cleavage dioxygenase [Polaromonas sp.]
MLTRPNLSTSHLLPRRHIAAALIAAPVVWTLTRSLPARAQTGAPRILTPSQTEGPFYPVALPKDADFDLLKNGSLDYRLGQPAWLEGSVTDLQGTPVRGALVEIWQCDHAGHYDHPGDGGRIDKAFQGFGRVAVNAQGEYRFRTIRPVAYSSRTPHIHVKVKLASRELLTTQLYVAGEPLNQRDYLWRNLSDAQRNALSVPFSPEADGQRARFNIVVAA